jgi:hypothetical protein
MALGVRTAALTSRTTEGKAHSEPPPGGAQLHRALPNQSSLLGDMVGSDVPPPTPLKIRPKSDPRPPGESRWWPFSYVQRGLRDPRFDLLRGLCLIVMVVNNLGGQSWLYALTGAGAFYISAGEGFVFIAGYVLGLNAAREPLGVTVRHLVSRAGMLYRLAVGITLTFSLLATLGHLHLWYPLPDATIAAYAGRPDAYLIGTLTLAIAYHGAEFLVLYILCFLVAPLALLACAEGKGWLVPLASMGLYLAVQLYPDQFHLPFATAFSFEAWQLLFFAGLTIGYHRPWLDQRIAAHPGFWWGYAGLIVVAALGLLGLYRQGFAPGWLFDRENVGAIRAALTPRRLLVVAIYLQFFVLLATWFWGLLRAALGWFLLSLGRHSLWVYILHLPIIVLFHNVPYLERLDRNTGTAAQILAIVALWGSIKLRDWAGGSAYRAALPAPRPFRSLARR